MEYPFKIGSGILPENRKEIFYEEPHEYLIMVGGGSTYGAKWGGNDAIPTATAYILGSIDLTTGERTEGKSIFTWIITEEEYQKRVYSQYFKEGVKYRIKGFPSKKSSGFYPIEVLGTVNRMPFLDALWRDYLAPVYMHSELFGEMELNKRYGYFHANFDWLGTEIEVSFNTDEEEDEKCLANLEEFCREAERRDKEVRDFAAEELTYLANDWRDDDHLDHEITEEEFKTRIKISSVEMSADGDYDVWFDDDDMFAGHSVHISGDALGAPNYSAMEG